MNQIDIMTRVDGYMALVLLHAPPSMIDSVLSGAALLLSKPCWYSCTALTDIFHAYVYVYMYDVTMQRSLHQRSVASRNARRNNNDANPIARWHNAVRCICCALKCKGRRLCADIPAWHPELCAVWYRGQDSIGIVVLHLWQR